MKIKTNSNATHQSPGDALIEMGYEEYTGKNGTRYKKPKSNNFYKIVSCDRYNYNYYSVNVKKCERE